MLRDPAAPDQRKSFAPTATAEEQPTSVLLKEAARKAQRLKRVERRPNVEDEAILPTNLAKLKHNVIGTNTSIAPI